jgi:transcriptional/translational regulatory protein YebC/TACO1
MFSKKGVIIIEKNDKTDEDTLMMDVLDAGADDFKSEDEYYEITTAPGDFSKVREELEKKGYEFVEAEISMVPSVTTTLSDAKQVEMMEKLIENLEDMDDVQNVWHNWEQE